MGSSFFLTLTFLLFGCNHSDIKKIMIRGDSMVPDLTANTVYLMTETKEVKKDDLVVFKRKTSKDKFVKKIYCVPGDLVEYNLQLRAIEVNNTLLTRKDGGPIMTSMRQFRIMAQSLDNGFLEKDKYLVFSSNLSNTYDSRTYGAISEEEIVGVILKYKDI